MSFCRSCGCEIQAGNKFCTNCGASVAAGKPRQAGPKNSRSAQDQSPETAPSAAPPFRVLSGVFALFWLIFSGGFLGVLMRPASLGSDDILRVLARADWITVAIILGVPFATSVFAPALDVVLRPVEAVKAAIPRRLLALTGVMTPLIVAWFFAGALGFKGYGLIHASFFFGMVITYVIMREPEGVDQ